MAAFDGTIYNHWGLDSKPKTKIDEVMNGEYDSDIYNKIEYNTTQFKRINALWKNKQYTYTLIKTWLHGSNRWKVIPSNSLIINSLIKYMTVVLIMLLIKKYPSDKDKFVEGLLSNIAGEITEWLFFK